MLRFGGKPADDGAGRTAAGDDVDVLVRAHWREVHAQLTAIVGNAATAEDLAQEVFLLAFRKGLRPGIGARTWFRKTARFIALNERRRKRPLPMEPADIERLCDAHGARSGGAEPDFEAELAALKRCLADLNESDRRLLAGRYERRDPLERIASAEGQTVGYLKQRLFRLRLKLRACVKKRLGAGGDDELGRLQADSGPD